jgi:hypothetical protein
LSERAKITAWLFLTSIGGSCGVDAVDAVGGVSGDLGSLARSQRSIKARIELHHHFVESQQENKTTLGAF